jgi:pilus assembly protein CpaE
MKAKIITDSPELATRLRQVLGQLPTSEARLDVSEAALNTIEPQMLLEAGGLLLFGLSQIDAPRLECLRQVRATVGRDATVVVVAKATENQTILSTIRAGATDFLMDDEGLPKELGHLILRTRADGQARASKGQSTLVLPTSSPRDSAWVAANLAAALAKTSPPCALIDLHLSGGDMAMLYKLMPRHSVIDLMTQEHSLDQIVVEQALAIHESQVRLLAGPITPVEEGVLHSTAVARVIDLVRHSHSQLLVSVESVRHALPLLASGCCEQVLIAMHLDVVSLHRTKQLVDQLLRQGVRREQLQVAGIGLGQSGALSPSDVGRVLQVADVHGVPYDLESLVCSINLGNPFVLEFPKSKSSQALMRLAESMTLAKGEPRPVSRLASLGLKAKEALNLFSTAKM